MKYSGIDDDEYPVILVENEVAWCGFRDNVNQTRFIRKYDILLMTLKGTQVNIDPLAAEYLSEITVTRSKLAKLWPRDSSVLLSKTLVDLRLDRNDLESLPSHLSLLTNLRILKLDHNKLRGLPASFGVFKKMVKINLSNNLAMKRIPDCVFKMTSLTLLRVEEIGLEYIPAKIRLLPLLEHVQMGRNLLWEIPIEFTALENLTNVCLVGNPITNQDVLNSLLCNKLGITINRLTLPKPCKINDLVFPINFILTRGISWNSENGRMQFSEYQRVTLFMDWHGQRVAKISKKRRISASTLSSVPLNSIVSSLLNLCLAYVYDHVLF